MDNIVPDDTDEVSTPAAGAPDSNLTADAEAVPENRENLVKQIAGTIQSDKRFHAKAFKRMKRDMFVAMHGREETWSDKNYKANIAGRHVKQKTNALYAKNPKATAKRADRLDFAVWDEDPQSLMLAFQTIQTGIAQAQAHQAVAAAAATGQPAALPPPAAPGAPAPAAPGAPAPGAPAPAAAGMASPTDPTAAPAPVNAPPGVAAGQEANLIGHNGGPALEAPQMPPGYEMAMAVVQDFQQGMQRRKMLDKIGRTLEILFAKAMRDQKPVDFKTGAKQFVRRTCTTGVGYVELAFQREYGPQPTTTAQMGDIRTRLDHLRTLAEEAQEGEIEDNDAEMAELELALQALQTEPEVVTREGLIFDFPASTKVIPDKLTKKLVGFIGARHITIEYEYTCEQVKEIFGVDLQDGQYKNYTPEGKSVAEVAGDLFDEDGTPQKRNGQKGLVRVWKHYRKEDGLVYYVADGYKDFLRDPAPPEVFVEDFWPVYALTFNDVESEDDLFPPSDVTLLLDMQNEHNRSRQGAREHREARRPRWAFPNGAIEEADLEQIKKVKPFDAIGINIDPQTKLADMLQAFPVPGVDPNLYETSEIFNDMELVVGTSQPQLGGLSKASATESALAANASASSDSSSVDDLDDFLTTIVRASGQILLREMSQEQVMKIVGPGAVWPELQLQDIADDVYLDIEAGSSGKPNQAVEINNWKTMLPFLIQMGGIRPIWLARETLRRLDDKMDLTDALSEGIPAMVAQNRMAQPAPENPANAPAAQGPEGADKTSKPASQGTGSGPAFGSNQV